MDGNYLSYLAQTYFFKTRGLLVTGLLGGLYSSTAISVVISRRAKYMADDHNGVSSALIMATAMMYLRLLVILSVLDSSTGKGLLLPFSIFITLFCLLVFCLLYFGYNVEVRQPNSIIQHPLELSTAFLFALLFVIFAFITQYVISHFGDQGLSFLSVVVGFTDIDPFIHSLLSGNFSVPENVIVSAAIVASGSNNLLKAIYAAILARNCSVMMAVIWMLSLFVISISYAFSSF